MKKYSRKMWFFLGFGDLLHINLSFFLAYYLRFASFNLPERYIFLLLIFNFSWLVVASIFKLFQVERIIYFDQVIYNLLKATVVHLSLMTSILFIMKVTTTFKRTFYLYLFTKLIFLGSMEGLCSFTLKKLQKIWF